MFFGFGKSKGVLLSCSTPPPPKVPSWEQKARNTRPLWLRGIKVGAQNIIINQKKKKLLTPSSSLDREVTPKVSLEEKKPRAACLGLVDAEGKPTEQENTETPLQA